MPLNHDDFFQNGMFMGPVLSVPLMLLSSYGMGWGDEPVPALIRLAMNFSYLRYGLEGIIVTIYGLDRETLPCSTDYCHLREPKSLLKHVRSFSFVNFCRLNLFLLCRWGWKTCSTGRTWFCSSPLSLSWGLLLLVSLSSDWAQEGRQLRPSTWLVSLSRPNLGQRAEDYSFYV